MLEPPQPATAAAWAIAVHAAMSLAFFAFPVVAVTILRGRPQLVPDWWMVFWLFAFSLACGVANAADAAWWGTGAYFRVAALTAAALFLGRAIAVRAALRAYASPAEYARLAAVAAIEAAARREAQTVILAEFDRRGRQVVELTRELDGLRDQLAGLLHRHVTDADYMEIRRRLHAIRGVA